MINPSFYTYSKTDPHSDYSTSKSVSVGIVERVDAVRRLISVRTNDHKLILCSLPEGGGRFGDGWFSLPPSGMGWRCVVDQSSGHPIISSFLPPVSAFSEEAAIDKRIQSGGKTLTLLDSLSGSPSQHRSYKIDERVQKKQNLRSNKFFDLVGGDWGYRGTELNGVAVLRGGVSSLWASPLCGAWFFQEDDHARLLGRSLEIFSDWGIMEFSNNEGKTRFSLRGNSGENPEYKTREASYEFSLDIGAVGEREEDKKQYRLMMKYVPPHRDPFFMGIDKQGALVIKSPKDIWEYSGEDRTMIAKNNVGIFSGDSTQIESNGYVEIAGGVSVDRDPLHPEIFTKTNKGKRILIDGTKIKEGDPNKAHKPYVIKDHLDKYNGFITALSTALNALVPGIGTTLEGFKDSTNYTADVEGT